MTRAISSPLCTVIQRNVKWVWRELRMSSAVAHKLGEESLTDFFILKLLEAKPKGFCIQTFTRHEEGVTGSDWEWWFGNRFGEWVGMRVQAKIIDVASGHYRHLHYAPAGQPQVDKLINNARPYRMIPIYCLYTYWDKAQGTRPKTPYGVSCLPAEVVRHDYSEKHTDLRFWLPKMTPLAWLLCVNPLVYPASFADGVLANLERANVIEANDHSRNRQRWIHGELPVRVAFLRETQGIWRDTDEWDSALRGVMVVESTQDVT